jgi:MFS family permease
MKFLKRYEDEIQLVSALVAAVLMGWWLHGRGWRWFEWLPAAILAVFGVGLVWIIAWFLCRKLTYRQMAARNKAHLQAGGDGWPGHRAEGEGAKVEGQG